MWCEQLIIGRRTHIVSSDCLQIKHKNYYISSISCVFFIGRRHFVHKSKHGWHFEMTSSFHLQKKFWLGYRVSSLKFIKSVFVLKHVRGRLQTTLTRFWGFFVHLKNVDKKWTFWTTYPFPIVNVFSYCLLFSVG